MNYLPFPPCLIFPSLPFHSISMSPSTNPLAKARQILLTGIGPAICWIFSNTSGSNLKPTWIMFSFSFSSYDLPIIIPLPSALSNIDSVFDTINKIRYNILQRLLYTFDSGNKKGARKTWRWREHLLKNNLMCNKSICIVSQNFLCCKTEFSISPYPNHKQPTSGSCPAILRFFAEAGATAAGGGFSLPGGAGLNPQPSGPRVFPCSGRRSGVRTWAADSSLDTSVGLSTGFRGRW